MNVSGVEPAQADPELPITVLRDEWGCRGFVESDWYGDHGEQDARQADQERQRRYAGVLGSRNERLGLPCREHATRRAGDEAGMQETSGGLLETAAHTGSENLETGPMGWRDSSSCDRCDLC